MFEVGLANVCDEINEAFRQGNFGRVEGLLWPALDQFSELPQLWFYAGNVFFQTGRPALAGLCFERCVALDENPLVLANLGASYRRLNQHQNGLMVLKKALDLHPDYEPALVNYGAMWVNEGRPEEGIPYLEKAVALGKAKGKLETGAEWNLGLLYLESGRFAEGFDIYRRGLGSERLVRSYAHGDVGEPKRLEPEDHASVVAGAALGKEKPTLIVWGEQGIGDELNFAACFNEASYRYNIIFECHPRLEKIHRTAKWVVRARERGENPLFFPTRKETKISWPQDHNIKADFKCPIGDLAAFFRRDAMAFKKAWEDSGPYYGYDVDECQRYTDHLRSIAKDRAIVGLATHGGVMTTARAYRTLRLPEIEYLFANTDCVFVGFDYDDMTPMMFHLHEKFPGRYVWFPSIVQHWDYDHTAALLAATDMNVLVCQSAAHLSAAIGAETRVLAPKRAAWREIMVPDIGKDRWYLYPGENTKMYMQTDPESWTEPLDRVIADIKGLK